MTDQPSAVPVCDYDPAKEQYYVLFIWSDVEPSLFGPYATPDLQVARARELRRTEGRDHGLFRIAATPAGPIVDSFCGADCLDEDEEE